MPLQHLIHYYLARFHLALRRHDAAAVAYRQALAANPQFALAAAGLGFLHATRERYAEAADASRNSIPR